MVRQTAKVLVLEVLGGLALVLLVAVCAAGWRLASGPVDLSRFVDDVEHALSRARGGREVTIDSLALEWLPKGRRLVATASGVTFMSEAGDPAARAERAEISLEAGALAIGRVKPLTLDLADGWVGLVETDGGWRVAGEPVGGDASRDRAPPTLPADPEALFGAANRAMSGVLEGLREGTADLDLERISFRDFRIVALDKTGAEALHLEAAAGRLTFDPDRVDLSLSARAAPDQGLPTDITAILTAPRDFAALRAEVGFKDWSLEALSARFSGGDLTADGVPADFVLALEASAEGGLELAEIDIDAGQGRLLLDDGEMAFGGGRFQARYAAEADTLSVMADPFSVGPAEGALQATLGEVLRGESGARPFTFDGSDLTVDLTPTFVAPVQFDRLKLDGSLDPATLRLTAEALEAVSRGATLTGAGAFEWKGEPSETRLPLDVSLDARLEGPWLIDDLLAMWPWGLSDGAREYIVDNVSAARLVAADVKLDLKPESKASGRLTRKSVDVRFEIRDATVAVLDMVPPVTGAGGFGVLTGDGLSLDVQRGVLESWTIETADVEIPTFDPDANELRVQGRGYGPIQDLVQIASQSELQIEARTGFDPDRLSGDGEMTLDLVRPPFTVRDSEPTRFTARGRAKAAGLTDAVGSFDLNNVTAETVVTDTDIEVSGFGDLDEAPIRFTWRDRFDDDDPLSDVEAAGAVTPDLLNRFGVPGRAYFTGEAPMSITARAGGEGVDSAQITVDFTPARLDIAEIGWVKPAGTPADGRLRLALGASGSTASVVFRADDFEVDGDAVLNADGGVESANLRRAYLADKADIGGSIRRGLDDGLILRLFGAFLDVSGFMEGVGAIGDMASDTTSDGGLDAPVTIEAEVDRLRLREGLYMDEAELTVEADGGGLKKVRATGLGPGGAEFSGDYALTESGAADFMVESSDASFLIEALFGVDFVVGGELGLRGTLPEDGGPIDLELRIRDARLMDTPFLTKVLTLGSLRGLSDTLSGEGVLFRRVEVPMTIAGGRYIFRNARASGPALGLTTAGYVGAEDGSIELKGVIVPSYGANSFIGGVPILGDILAGGEGEGVFSLNYSVEGTLERAQIAVNPLSGLAPGVLRRLFQSPADTSIPEPEEEAEVEREAAVTPGE